MKTIFVIAVVAMGVSLVSCVGREAKTTETVVLVPPTVKADVAFLNDADRDIESLEGRLKGLRTVALHSWVRYKGSHKNFHVFVDSEFEKLGKAKEDSLALRKAEGDDVARLETRLSSNLASLRTDIATAEKKIHGGG